MTERKVDSIPVWFIKAESDRMLLEYQIAISEGDYEVAEYWSTKHYALEECLEKWRREYENHD